MTKPYPKDILFYSVESDDVGAYPEWEEHPDLKSAEQQAKAEIDRSLHKGEKPAKYTIYSYVKKFVSEVESGIVYTDASGSKGVIE